MIEKTLPAISRTVRTHRNHAWRLGALVLTLLAAVAPSQAGQLVIENAAQTSIACTVDGYTIQSGANHVTSFTVEAGTRLTVAPNSSLAVPAIKWVQCGKLKILNLPVTATSPDHNLLLNGLQTRVLNVSLYPYLPSAPANNFSALLNYVVQTYQAQNPLVLLNAVMDQAVNTYSFDALPGYLGSQGFDVMELDMLYLGFLVSNGLVNPQQAPATAPLSVAQSASSIGGVLYGIPSWLCMDFLYSTNPAVQGLTSLSALQSFLALASPNQTALVGDYDGKWRLPSMYVNAYAQTYGYTSLQNAFTMPPDATVMANLSSLVKTCTNGGSDYCIDGTYHNAADGITEQVFASGTAYTDMGFSEQSFFVALAGDQAPLYVAPVPWGNNPQPLLFADSFVTNSTTCQPSSPCAGDAANFIGLMTSMQMKNYIVTAQDLQLGTPWRTLLVPYQQFYAQPQISDNALYQQYQAVFNSAQPFPNTWTASTQTSMRTQICAAFQANFPNYYCTTASAAKQPLLKKATHSTTTSKGKRRAEAGQSRSG